MCFMVFNDKDDKSRQRLYHDKIMLNYIMLWLYNDNIMVIFILFMLTVVFPYFQMSVGYNLHLNCEKRITRSAITLK